jgi:hypothetical protein
LRRNLSEFLSRQRELLDRLLLEANEGEKEDANRRFKDNLPVEELISLPLDLFQNPRMSHQLLLEHQADMAGPMHQWKEGFDEVMNLPPMSEQEARQEAEGLSLESFLSRLL